MGEKAVLGVLYGEPERGLKEVPFISPSTGQQRTAERALRTIVAGSVCREDVQQCSTHRRVSWEKREPDRGVVGAKACGGRLCASMNSAICCWS